MLIRRFYCTVIFILYGAVLWGGTADYFELSEVLEKTGARLEWEPLGDLGILEKGDKTAVFKINTSFLILDYQEKLATPGIIRKNGAVLFPNETTAKLVTHFAVEEIDELHPRIAVVLIDPGHGGKDPGAIGEYGKTVVREKDVVLGVAKRLYSLLTAQFPAKRVLLTRSGDSYLELEERTEIANGIPLEQNEAIIFISLHANAAFSDKARGFEVWYLPQEYKRDLSDRMALEEENPDIVPILNTMLEIEFATESVFLAKKILDALDNEIGDLTPNRGLKEETWFVVRNSKMPAVLIELGFVTNPEEAELLQTDEYLNTVSRAIYTGIQEFIGQFENTKGFTE